MELLLGISFLLVLNFKHHQQFAMLTDLTIVKILYQPQNTAYCDRISYGTRKNCIAKLHKKDLKDWPHGEIQMGEILMHPLGIVISHSLTAATLVTGEIALANDPLIKRKEHSVIFLGRNY